MLNEADALAVLSALSQETRLRIVRVLLGAVPHGLPAGRIGARVGCAPSTLTFHLRHLQQAGLIRSRREATSLIYSAAPDVVGSLADYLMQECCGGRPELCRPAEAPTMDDATAAPLCCCAGAKGAAA